MAKLGQAETTWLWHSHQNVDDFGLFCHRVKVKLTKDIIKLIVDYVQKSEDKKHTYVISADDPECYGNGKLGAVDLLIQLKSSGLIRKDDKGIYYYDGLQEIFHGIDFDGYRDILTDNAVPCPLPAIPAAFKAFRDNRHNPDISSYSCNWILKNKPASIFHLGNGLKNLLPNEMNRLVDYITLSSEDMLGVPVLNAGERRMYHPKEGREAQKGPSELCTTLMNSGVIYKSGPYSYLYCDVLVDMLKLLGMGGHVDALFKETLGAASIPTLDLQPARELSVQDTTGAVSVGKHLAAAICRLEPSGELSVQDIDPSTVYISRCNPKDLGQFAFAFGQKVNTNEVAEIAGYLFVSSELLFSVRVLSADERVEFEKGKKRGRHLIYLLKETEVITTLSDGTFNYNGLVRILFAVNLGRLCDQLLQKNPEDTSAT